MSQSYLKPRVSSPPMIRDRKRGMFANPPAYIEGWGGFTSSEKLRRGKLYSDMALEKGGPQARGSKPF